MTKQGHIGAVKAEIVIWRDSVAAGDDVDAPHELRIASPGHQSLDSLVTRIIQANYLASIAGGKATWILKSGERALAVVAQQWPAPCFLVPAEAQRTILFERRRVRPRVHLLVPGRSGRVFECLANGKPLPDRHGA